MKKGFFAYPKDYIRNIRWNALQMVHYGFTREEVYFMPITELQDYIKILNEQHEEEEQARLNAMHSNSAPQEGITSGMINMN